MSDSVYPALQRVLHWTPVRWALGAVMTAALPYAGWWARSRADVDDVDQVQDQVADEVQVKTAPRDSNGDLVTLATRVKTLEQQVMRCDDRQTAADHRITFIRLDLVGFQAASATPRAAQRAETAKLARDTYLDEADLEEPVDTKEQKAYRRALETRPPR